MKLAVPVAPRKRKFAPIPFQGPLEHTLPLVREIGFEGIELNIRHPDEVDARALAQLLDVHRLELVAITTGAAFFEEGLCLAEADAGRRAQAVERIVAQCDLASHFGAQVVIGIMRGRLDDDPAEAERQQHRFAASLDACAEAAADRGVGLVVEPINRYETNYLPTVASALELLDRVGRDNVTLLPDTFHMNIEERDIAEAFAQAAGRIGFVQFVDSNRRAPGQGHIDFASCIAALAAGAFDGYVSAEVLPMPDGPTAARQTVEYLRPLLTQAR